MTPQRNDNKSEATERERFEAWYVEDMVRQMPNVSVVADEVRALREGDSYGAQRVMLNGKWQGWQARAALAMPLPEQAEPTLYQYRTRPDWIEQWGEWTNCTAGSAADYERTPVLHDWHYEVRRLYLANPPAAPAGPTDEMRARANEIASMARPEYFNRVRSMVLALAAPVVAEPKQ